MQEESSEKLVVLSVRCTKLTAEVLQKSMKVMLNQMKKEKEKLAHPRGKQSLKKLMDQNVGTSSIEINNKNIKAFDPVAKKYHIDYHLRRVKGEKPPRYLVFFKGQDVDVMMEAFKEFTAKSLKREQKPSIRKMLAAFKEQAAQRNAGREKVSKKDRGQEL